MKDPCIRRILQDTALLKFQRDGSSKIVEELKISAARARIDIAVINGHLHGFEIKSASDTLARLPGQIEAYTKVFDYLAIVTEGKYYQRLLDTVPEWVSIYVCWQTKTGARIRKVRKGRINSKQEGFHLAKLLWREELIEVLNELNIDYRKKDRNWLLCEALAAAVPVKKLSRIVRQKLKARDDWKTDSTASYAVV
jgi:hypothetical protein